MSFWTAQSNKGIHVIQLTRPWMEENSICQPSWSLKIKQDPFLTQWVYNPTEKGKTRLQITENTFCEVLSRSIKTNGNKTLISPISPLTPASREGSLEWLLPWTSTLGHRKGAGGRGPPSTENRQTAGRGLRYLYVSYTLTRPYH